MTSERKTKAANWVFFKLIFFHAVTTRYATNTSGFSERKIHYKNAKIHLARDGEIEFTIKSVFLLGDSRVHEIGT